MEESKSGIACSQVIVVVDVREWLCHCRTGKSGSYNSLGPEGFRAEVVTIHQLRNSCSKVTRTPKRSAELGVRGNEEGREEANGDRNSKCIMTPIAVSGTKKPCCSWCGPNELD